MVATSVVLVSKTVRDAVYEISHCLQKHPLYYGHGLESPLDEAAYLVSFVLGLPPDFCLQKEHTKLAEQQRLLLQELLQQRVKSRKPLAYIIGQTWLAGQQFFVNEHVLIPRSPLAELIDAQFKPWWPNSEPEFILDLCTGSGCLGILAAKQFPAAQVHISDIDLQALQVAKRNIAAHQLENRVTPIHSDLFARLPKQRYDIIIANPPYVPLSEQSELPSEYHHEPAHALFAGEKGLEFAEQILLSASEYLNQYGILLLEVGQSAQALQNRFPQHDFMWLELERGGEGVCVLTSEQCQAIANSKFN